MTFLLGDFAMIHAIPVPDRDESWGLSVAAGPVGFGLRRTWPWDEQILLGAAGSGPGPGKRFREPLKSRPIKQVLGCNCW